MTIMKTTIEVVVLHEETDDVASWSLEQIAGEMNEGCIVGSMSEISSTAVEPGRLDDELIAIGNDGSFFNYDAEVEGYPRLSLYFQPQDWDGDYAVEVGDAIKFDGTRAALKLYGVEQLKSLDLGEGDNDILVQRGATTPEIDDLMGSGPYEVQAGIGGVTEFFTINGFDGITEDALAQLRARYGIEAEA